MSRFDTVMRTLLHEWGITTLGGLQLVTAKQLTLIPNFAERRIDRARTYLESEADGGGRRLRAEDESFAACVFRVYGHARHVPVGALPLYVELCKAPVDNMRSTARTLVARQINTFGKLFIHHKNTAVLCRIFGNELAARWIQTFLTPLFV